jgi:ribonucleoside-diphosphate reductase alpha chain
VDQECDGRQPAQKLRARDLLYKMAESTWHCGDPGMQYDTTVNRWHTCKTTARINASNPCSSTCSWMTRPATWRPSI